MSGNTNPKIGAPKRRSSPNSDPLDDLEQPEKRFLSSDKREHGEEPLKLQAHEEQHCNKELSPVHGGIDDSLITSTIQISSDDNQSSDGGSPKSSGDSQGSSQPSSSGSDEAPLCANDSLRRCLKPKGGLSAWEGYGINNVFDILQLNKRHITVLAEDFFTEFISERDGFVSTPIQTQDQEDLDTFFKIVDKCMNFELKDAVLRKNSVRYQYGGYNPAFPDSISPAALKAVLAELDTCYMDLLDVTQGKSVSLQGLQVNMPRHLSRYIYCAMDFIKEAAKIIMHPTKWQERAYEDLFRVFCRISGIDLQDAAREPLRHVKIFGELISGKPDMRIYVPLDNGSWWRQRPVNSSLTVPKKPTLSAVVEVKPSLPNEPDSSIQQETEKYLGQLVGEMLAEFLPYGPDTPLIVSGSTHMLGILVVSTKVYFVKLHVPEGLRELYAQAASRCQDKQIEKGTVYVTQAFDFMKRSTRLDVLKILHKIGSLTLT